MERRKQRPSRHFRQQSPMPIMLFEHIIGTVIITPIIGTITIITIDTGVTITGIIGSRGVATGFAERQLPTLRPGRASSHVALFIQSNAAE